MDSRRTRPHNRLTGLALATICLALCAGCPQENQQQTTSPPPKLKTLTIITPHNEKIRQAFEVGFSDWHEKKHGVEVNVRWIVRGTPQCVEYIDNIFEGKPREAGGLVPDVMFGGGIADHQRLADEGRSMALDMKDVLEGIPADVRGAPIRDPENRWFATSLSSFGIVYNKDACEQRGIAAPTTWSDLADPRFHGWVAVADPSASGSHRESMVFVVEKEGWNQGWGTLVRILGNCRALAASSKDVLNQVRSGVLLAGFAVSFDGMALADATGGRIAYVNPKGATAATPNVTSVLKTAADRKLAADFVRFSLSREGQILWGVKAEDRDSYGDTLYHYPIDPRIYEEFKGKLAVTENPFETGLGLAVEPEREGQLGHALVPMVDAACGANHIELQKVWEQIIADGMPQAAVDELTKPIADEKTAIQTAEQKETAEGESGIEKVVQDWSEQFKKKYDQVRELVKS